ncbi:MAG: DUF3667 domain-containing protein [Chitinophagaceae bacterium]|nr:DUF3667 domain-containing protein [Chitinophagaceae bacterium]
MDSQQPTPPKDTTIVCKNCNNYFSGKYCNQCGEKVYKETDKKISLLFEDAFHFITHLEGSFFTTLKTIFKTPGQLSTDYCGGIRKRYFKPLSLFLLLVVLYLLFPLASGLNMPLKNHMDQNRYGEFATQKVENYLQRHPDKTYAMLEEKFAAKSEKLSKLLLLLIVPCSALILWALTFFKRKYFFDQMVISAEINSFFLIANFFLLPILILLIFLAAKIFHFSVAWVTDAKYTFVGQAFTALFTALAMKRFYGFKRIYRIVASLVFIYFHGFIVYSLYKFTLFVAVFYQIH